MNQNPLAGLLSQPPLFAPPQNGDLITYKGMDYQIGAQIGTGSFGAVFDCVDEWGNELVAKVLVPQSKTYAQLKDDWIQEFAKLKQLRHPRITYIHQAFECNQNFYLIVEKCAFTLETLIGNTQSTAAGEVWLPYIARDVLNALHYIHEHGFVHKDLHAGNILVSQQRDIMVPAKPPVWQFKVADLGISRLEGEIRLFNTILAPWMVPPEYLDPQQFGVLGKHVDIYHFGLLMLGLLSNRLPTFTAAEIVQGLPSTTAAKLPSIYAPVLSKALLPHVNARTPSALQVWRDISSVLPITT